MGPDPVAGIIQMESEGGVIGMVSQARIYRSGAGERGGRGCGCRVGTAGAVADGQHDQKGDDKHAQHAAEEGNKASFTIGHGNLQEK